MKFPTIKYIMGAKAVALVGVMAATVECGKLALSFLPNVEVVTMLIALYGYVFGWYGVAATLVFVCIEPLIYGFGGWVITYIIYWPLVAIIFMLLRKYGVKNRWLITVVAIGMTVLFGLLSSAVDCAIYFGISKYYLSNFWLYYIRGSVFYLIQIACNAALFSTIFPYLSRKLGIIYASMRLQEPGIM